jgi:hypothetical protein
MGGPFAEHPVRLAAAAGAAEENLEHRALELTQRANSVTRRPRRRDLIALITIHAIYPVASDAPTAPLPELGEKLNRHSTSEARAQSENYLPPRSSARA